MLRSLAIEAVTKAKTITHPCEESALARQGAWVLGVQEDNTKQCHCYTMCTVSRSDIHGIVCYKGVTVCNQLHAKYILTVFHVKTPVWKKL